MPDVFEDICPRCLEPFKVSGDACVGGSFCPRCEQFSAYAPPKAAAKPGPRSAEEIADIVAFRIGVWHPDYQQSVALRLHAKPLILKALTEYAESLKEQNGG